MSAVAHSNRLSKHAYGLLSGTGSMVARGLLSTWGLVCRTSVHICLIFMIHFQTVDHSDS